MKTALSFLLLVSFLPFASTQESINSSQYLERVFEEVRLSTSNKILKSQNFKAPIFEEFSFRTETNDFEFNRQEYAFRIDVSTPKKRRAQKALFNLYNENSALASGDISNDKILNAYENWLNIYFLSKRIILLKEIKLVYQDRYKVLEKKSLALENEFVEVLKTQKKLSEIELEIFEKELRLDQITSKNGIDKDLISFDDMISINQISEIVNLKSVQNDQYVNTEYELEKQIIEKELSIERAEQNEIFDFGQIRYRGPHETGIEERIQLGVAFNFPNDGNRKLKIAKLQVEKDELDLKNDIERLSLNYEADLILNELNNQVELLSKLVDIKTKEFEQARELSDLISRKQGIDPLLLLEIKLNVQDYELEKDKLESNIYELYLEYLVHLSMIYSKPLRNYLKS